MAEIKARAQARTRLLDDGLKLLLLGVGLLGVLWVFVATPSLMPPTLLSVVFTLMISPVVAVFERQGFSRTRSIILIFLSFGLIGALSGVWLSQLISAEWGSFVKKAPETFKETLEKLAHWEVALRYRYPIFDGVKLVEQVRVWGSATGDWFLINGAGIAGQILTSFFIVPIFTFFLLKEGRVIKRRIFALIPNTYFESWYMMLSQVMHSLSDYIRAKLIEALILGTLVSFGLLAFRIPYAFVLGTLAGITNIVPYVGPFLGIAPGLLLILTSEIPSEALMPMLAVFGIANLIDTVLIFPVFVGRIVKLHPVLLIAAVIVGQRYYGLVGMLISVPIATACKIVAQEVYFAVYRPRDLGTGAG